MIKYLIISTMNIIFLDTETSGISTNDRLLEVSYSYNDQPIISERFKPPCPINLQAMAVHHITEQDVADKSLFTQSSMFQVLSYILPDSILCCHNLPFDLEMLRKEGLPEPKFKIDTLKVVRHLFPLLDCYKLQFLRYFFNLIGEVQAHSAEGDVYVLKSLFKTLIGVLTEKGIQKPIEWMIEMSKRPCLLAKVPFGKYKGCLFTDVKEKDIGYLRWMKTIASDDLVYTLNTLLKNKDFPLLNNG